MLGALALALIGIIALSGRTFWPRARYHIDFLRIGGLAQGATVRLSGLAVGKVETIAFAPRGLVRAEIAVDRAFAADLHENSEFFVGMGSTLLSEPSLDIGPPHGEPGRVLYPGEALRG